MDSKSPKDHDDNMDRKSPPPDDDVMDQEASKDEDNESKVSRGPTLKAKSREDKVLIKYNKKGVPIGEGATQLATFEGLIARTLVPITYETWHDVDKDAKEDLWKYILTKFELNPKSRKNSLRSIGIKWRNFKHYLFKNYIEPFKDEPKAPELKDPPALYSNLKDDWKLFVSQRLSSKFQKKSEKNKKVRAHCKYNHRLSRKGYAGLTAEIMKETGLEEEEIDRTLLWKKARELKTGGYTEDVKEIVDKIDDLQKNESLGEVVSLGTNDLLTQALGTKENRGRVRGMGKFVTPHQYFYLPSTMKHFVNKEEKLVQRMNKLESDMEQLKKGGYNNVSEGASCYMEAHSDGLEYEPDEETLDESCLLAVNVTENVVAKGTITNQLVLGDNFEVIMQTFMQGEALLPIPLEDEFIVKVKDAVGHVLLWPKHLVIRCSDLGKLTKKPDTGKKIARKKEMDERDGKKKPENLEDLEVHQGKKEPEKVDMGKKKAPEKVNLGKKKAMMENLEEVLTKMDKKRKGTPTKGTGIMGKKQTREETSIRKMQNSVVLDMVARMVDTFKSATQVRVQSEEAAFGHESFTYIDRSDFEAIWTMQKLTGAVIDSYMLHLYERTKNGTQDDHGFCFVSSSDISSVGQKTRGVHSEKASRAIADRMSNKQTNNFIVMPYNPGGHWVLAVLDMAAETCYYFDSLRPRQVDNTFKQIVEMAKKLYATGANSSKRQFIKWEIRKCPGQPGITECGYCVLKYMKNIVYGGPKMLEDKALLEKDEYAPEDFLDVREDWAAYIHPFIYQNVGQP